MKDWTPPTWSLQSPSTAHNTIKISIMKDWTAPTTPGNTFKAKMGKGF